MIICFYVSGHGYGHATRACKIISALLSLPARHTVHVVSLAPIFIFLEELRRFPHSVEGDDSVLVAGTGAGDDAATFSSPASSPRSGSSRASSRRSSFVSSPSTLSSSSSTTSASATLENTGDDRVRGATTKTTGEENGSATNRTPRWSYRNTCVEPGVIQPTAYMVDRETTVENLRLFVEDRETFLRREVAWLKSVGANAAATDAPFLPCAAASAAGIPAVVITNFTFDAVYEGILSYCPTSEATNDSLDSTIRKCLKVVKADYRCADALLCLPGHSPGLIPTFDNGNVLDPDEEDLTDADVLRRASARPPPSPLFPRQRPMLHTPLIARHAKRSREEVLDALGIPTEERSKKILLVNFGGQALARRSSPPSLPPDWIALVCGEAAITSSDHHRFYPVSRTAYIPDVIAASDIVLGKLGYGTLSECLIHQKPFLYVPRRQFIEEKGLVKLLRSREISDDDQGIGNAHQKLPAALETLHLPNESIHPQPKLTTTDWRMCLEISRENFESGRWADHITRLDRSNADHDQLLTALKSKKSKDDTADGRKSKKVISPPSSFNPSSPFSSPSTSTSFTESRTLDYTQLFRKDNAHHTIARMFIDVIKKCSKLP